MLKHAIFEGTKNLTRSFWLSITAIFIILVSLTSVALVASLWVVAGYTLRQFDNQAVIYVYLQKDVPAENISEMEKALKEQSEIKDVTFINKDKAVEELKNNPIAGRTFENVKKLSSQNNTGLDFIKESFKVIPQSSESYNKTEAFIRQERWSAIVDEIQGTQDFINNMQRVYYWSGIIGTILVFIFGLISILVMINILRIAIYSRREEIEIMRLVGATNSYIRGPFVAEGILYNFIASIFVFIIFIPILGFLSPSLERWLGVSVNTSSGNLLNNIYISLTITNITGLIIGGVAALVATQRYLKL
jgi:cell division transport system permease protein